MNITRKLKTELPPPILEITRVHSMVILRVYINEDLHTGVQHTKVHTSKYNTSKYNTQRYNKRIYDTALLEHTTLHPTVH